MRAAMSDDEECFWSIPVTELLKRLGTTPEGLTDEESQRRLSEYGYNLCFTNRS
jgi:hypothetical protein